MWYGIKYPHNQRFLGGAGGQNVALAKVCALLSARSSSKMYWARYVLVDQALRGGGMRSTECPSSLYTVTIS